MNSIQQIHKNKTGKVSDKWESYLRYYDVLLKSLEGQPIKLLEIGVQNGGSLETWAEFFVAAKVLVGCDIDQKCKQLVFDDARIKIVIGDACAPDTQSQILGISPNFDVIIDDGSHVSVDVLNTFIRYFPYLSPGGLYIIEDSHCFYMDDFGGGILNEYGAYAFFKKIIDVIGFQFWNNQISINSYFRTFFGLKATPQFILDGWIESIEFRNSIITIRKSTEPGHDKIGKRIKAGTAAEVQNWGGG